MKTSTTRFDAAIYLDGAERRIAYLKVALESGDPDVIRDAQRVIACARGMGTAAEKINLNHGNP